MGCTKVEDIDIHLESLPLDLDAYYEQAWERAIGETDPLRAFRARLILTWMTLAEQPLSLEGLQMALSLSGYHAEASLIEAEEIVSACAGFLRIESTQMHSPHPEQHTEQRESQPGITFIHNSAHRYLKTRQEENFPGADDKIVAACLLGLTARQTACRLPRSSLGVLEYGPY